MKTQSINVIVSLGILFGAIVAKESFGQGAGPEQSPKITDGRPNYEKLKTPELNKSLERCLADVSKAQDELRSLYAEGKVQRRLGINGMWIAHIKSTDADYSMVFDSKPGPIITFSKRVFSDGEHTHEVHEHGYEIYYYKDGRVERYARRDQRQRLSFYPTGGINLFSTDIDDRTSGEASWDADGKLQGEGLSPQLPRDTKGLPELENALRKGDYGVKREALASMVAIGPPSIPYALNVLKDGDEQSRELAVTVLSLLQEKAVPAVPDLVRQLREDTSPTVRQNLARCLGLIGPAAGAAIPALEEAAAKDVPAVATAAKTSLERIRKSP